MKAQLDLLRDQHAQLQTQYGELHRRNDILEAELKLLKGEQMGESFVEKIISTITLLPNNKLYSDLDIIVSNQILHGHRLVLASRTDFWGDLSNIDRIELNEVTYDVGLVILKWMYTESIDDKLGDKFLLEILKAAVQFSLSTLVNHCVDRLTARLEVDNCILMYCEAEHLNCDRLRNECTKFFADSFDQFKPEHFAEVESEILLKILKGHCKAVLHAIIRLKRADTLSLYIASPDDSVKLPELMNGLDENGSYPLDLALTNNDFDIALKLYENGADINQLDKSGRSFISKAIESGNVSACQFLVDHDADVNYINEETGETLIHDLAKSNVVQNEIAEWAKQNLHRFNLNALDNEGRTPLHLAVKNFNKPIFDLILGRENVNVNIADKEGHTPMQEALVQRNLEFGKSLVAKGADVNVADEDGNSLMHSAVISGDFAVIQFLAKCDLDVNKKNAKGSTVLHSFLFSLPSHGIIGSDRIDILKILLKSGANPTIVEEYSGLTPLHFAVQRDQAVLECLLESGQNKLPLNVLDREGQSPLWLALVNGKFDAARLLVKAGADVDEIGSEKDVLLIRAIRMERDDIVKFLLDNRANATVKARNNCSTLHLAVEKGMTSTVDSLCRMGQPLNAVNPLNGFVPLWMCLRNDDYGTAQVLIGHGCDLENWSIGEDSEETLLHKAIDERNEKVAIFLIKSGCDVNAIRKPLGGGESNLQTPLHIAVQWGLTDVSKALISNLKCKTDAQDADGRTAAHIAVLEQDQFTLDLLLSHPNPAALTLRDKYGNTPLAIAMKNRNNKMAESICRRLPHAPVQVNGNGENLLHIAIKSNDFESVLFLLGLNIDVNIPVNDSVRSTPLHLCAELGSEIILRNLLLAGAEVNAVDASGSTPLHISAFHDRADLCRVLVENDADPNLVDNEGNNCLHSAVAQGCIDATQTILLESDVNYLAVNKLKRNIAHLCASVPGIAAAEIFQTIIEIHPNFPLEEQDIYGNTMFLLSFINGNGDLCRLSLKYGVCLGATNHTGESIFKIDTPTKQLLYGLLGTLDREPTWAEGDFCSECEAKFTLTMRKHHCRHCGRLVCSKCSEQQMPILKYNLQKNVRVCQCCYNILTMGKDGRD